MQWVRAVVFFAGAMASASMHRVTFSVLAVPIRAEFGLSLPQMGVLHSAVLAGYILGQIPLGVLADRIGGIPVMQSSLLLWTLVTGATSLIRNLPPQHRFLALLAARAAQGLAQSCIMPATSAMAAKWVSEEYRARALTVIHASFSLGMVFGMLATPVLVVHFAWPGALMGFTLLGLAWAAFGQFTLPKEGMQRASETTEELSRAASQGRPGPGAGVRKGNRTSMWFQIALLTWTHCVIGWGGFIFQFWIPTYLTSLGPHNLESMGALSALPWAASAAVGIMAGNLADWLQKARGWKAVRVRALTQSLATLGPALSLLPLLLFRTRTPMSLAVGCLAAFMGLQAFCYAGFHAYVQDVAPKDAGKLLALTNSASTLVGFAANLITGALAGSRFGYTAVFGLTIAFYLASCLSWNVVMKGQEIVL
ncbi:g12420 [Coccomyxa viridis]|uniref:G12420 protein n=1 Tax=Coccomyxa viridis TaxID=1274662 RepID=A0ABP1GAA3_9CHLO